MMFHFVVITIIVLIGSQLIAAQSKLHVGIFYESLCPDSIRFVQNQLLPEYDNFADFVQLDFIPFGKSQSENGGASFTCQHGPAECEGNKIQSCVLAAAPDQLSQTKFVTCQMSYEAESSGQLCAEQAGIPFDGIPECVNGNEGIALQLAAERKTQAAANPRSILSFVPTIVYNKIFNQSKQNQSLRSFRSILCNELATTASSLPPICSGAK